MSSKIGIFRRIAVERYTRPIESDVPEMLAPHRPKVLAAGLLLLTGACWLLLW